MITYLMWNDFKDSIYERLSAYCGHAYKYSSSDLAGIFLLYLFLSPFTITADIIAMPFELLYFSLKRYFESKRGE